MDVNVESASKILDMMTSSEPIKHLLLSADAMSSVAAAPAARLLPNSILQSDSRGHPGECPFGARIRGGRWELQDGGQADFYSRRSQNLGSV
jgi:hypothetical protein